MAVGQRGTTCDGQWKAGEKDKGQLETRVEEGHKAGQRGERSL